MTHILDQTEVWRNKDGNLVRLDTMSGSYAANVYNMLRRSHKVVAFKYMAYLATVQIPDPDTMAYEIVSDEIDREYNRIREDALGWLMDKPLLKELAQVILEQGVRSDVATVEPVDPEKVPEAYGVPTFTVKPPVDDIDTGDTTEQDVISVFVVTSGSYSNYGIVAVYVGNRRAAYEHAAEHNRYQPWSEAQVEVYQDGCIGGPELYGQVRKYPPLYTEVTYRSYVDLKTAAVTSLEPDTAVRRAHKAEVRTEGSADGNKVAIVTTGPDTEIERIRKSHTEHIARAGGDDSEPLFAEGNDEVDL